MSYRDYRVRAVASREGCSTLALALGALALLIAAPAGAASISFAWDPPTPPDSGVVQIDGYKVYYDIDTGHPYEGTFADQGPSPIDLPIESIEDPNTPRVTLTGIDSCTFGYFAVTAYNSAGESGYSEELADYVVYRPTVLALKGGANSLLVSWDPLPVDDSGVLSSYAVHYDTDAPEVPYNGTGADQGDSHITVAADTTTLLMTGLDEGLTYHVVVGAHCAISGDRFSRPASGDPGACADDPDCDDGVACNGAETCSAPGCQVGSPYCAGDSLWCTDDCDETGAVTCDLLQPLTCLIDGVCWRAGISNPVNDCALCIPGTSSSAWTPAAQWSQCDDGDPCTSGESCQSGICTGGSGTCPDGGFPDTSIADVNLPDTLEADAGAADTAVPDTAAPDTLEADAGAADTAVPDTGAADTAATDTAAPDTAAPDTTAPDTAVVDTARPDTGAVDSAGGTDSASPDHSSVTDATSVGLDRAVVTPTGDAGEEPPPAEGCSCAARRGSRTPIALLLIVIGLGARTRRRHLSQL